MNNQARLDSKLISLKGPSLDSKFISLEGPTIATRTASKWGGVMIKLSGLSPCLLYSTFYVNSVVCWLLSVSH